MTSARSRRGVNAVDGRECGRRQRDRDPVQRPEQVLGIDRGVIGAAPRCDEHQVDGPPTEGRRDRLDRRPLPGQQPPGDIRLLVDLVVQAHGQSSRDRDTTAPAGTNAERVAMDRGTRPLGCTSPKMTPATASVDGSWME